MKDVSLVLVHRKSADILSSLVTMLSEGLKEVSQEPLVAHEIPSDYSGRAIVLGAIHFHQDELSQLDRHSIIFNVENTDSVFITDDYIRMEREFIVWDYDERNAKSLSGIISRPVIPLKLFYVEKLRRIDHLPVEDIDVLFYGSFIDRRERILDGLRERGLRVEARYRVFGGELDSLIARSKVVINIHYYENGRQEMVRLFDLLANGRAIVGEVNEGEKVEHDLIGAFMAAPYDELIDATVALVQDPARRKEFELAGFQAFSRRRADGALRSALASSEVARIPADAVVGSGKSYNPRLFNIDVSESWHPDIVADVSDHELFDRDFPSTRFGIVRLQRGWFDSITASHVIEHVRDLVAGMTNCLLLLTNGGLLRITVPYDLSYGAWQDPTHLHAFNERSWLYYCEWWWYLGWTEARFDLIESNFGYSELGASLAASGKTQDEILRTPRAVDEMRVVLRKRGLTDAEIALGKQMRGEDRQPGGM